MARPPLPLIVQWRDLTQEGRFYTDIAKDFPDYTASQIRHHCLGNSGANAPGPLQQLRRSSGGDDDRSNDKSEEDQYEQHHPQLAPAEPTTWFHVKAPARERVLGGTVTLGYEEARRKPKR